MKRIKYCLFILMSLLSVALTVSSCTDSDDDGDYNNDGINSQGWNTTYIGPWLINNQEADTACITVDSSFVHMSSLPCKALAESVFNTDDHRPTLKVLPAPEYKLKYGKIGYSDNTNVYALEYKIYSFDVDVDGTKRKVSIVPDGNALIESFTSTGRFLILLNIKEIDVDGVCKQDCSGNEIELAFYTWYNIYTNNK